MSPFSFGSKKSLKPSWKYSPNGVIWRILFGKSNRIVGEARDNEKKRVTFFCLDGSTGRPLWDNRVMKEPWWVGLEGVHEDVVLLHGFEQPDMPGHRGIEAWKAETGEMLWRNEETTFWFCYGQRVYTYRTLFERRQGFALDLHSGAVVETYDKGVEELFSVRQLALEEEVQGDLLFPELTQDEQGAAKAGSFLSEEINGRHIEGGVEHLTVHPYLIMNYHTPSKNSSPESLKLENHLAIIDTRDGARVFRDIVSKDATAPVPDSFFVRNGVMYCVKDQRMLLALSLPDLTEEEPS